MHAFTGCDTVSAFAGKGKAKALKLVRKFTLKLGQDWEINQEFLDKLEAFTCLLYAPKTSSRKINELRYHLFCAKQGEIEMHQLPPCHDCFAAGIWRRCLDLICLVVHVGGGRLKNMEQKST